MQGLIKSLIGPIVMGMGVSEADFDTYLSQCMGYVYGVLIVLIAFIVVLIAAQKLKKPARGFVRGTAVVACVGIIALIANLVCFGPMRSTLSTFMNAPSVELSDDTVAQSRETVKKVGEEGFVLLENDGTLPLAADTKNLNVFGWASTNPIYGGTGSGSSDASMNTGILEGLAEAGYTTNEELSTMYKEYKAERGGAAGAAAISSQSWNLPEPTADAYTDEMIQNAKDFSDTAVIVISRSGGEGADLPRDMNALIKGTYGNDERAASVAPKSYNYYSGVYENNGKTDDFDKGEHYLQLSNPEEDMIDMVCKNFNKVVLVVNANNPMELGWVKDHKQIGAVIYAPGPGVTGFTGLGEIISGAVNPSGRTVDTFVKDLTKTPTANNFGCFTYNNVKDLQEKVLAADTAYEGVFSFVNYVEGIYVGYKFYETAAEEGLIKYNDYVQYPFGYGLSYTEFDQKIKNFKADGDTVTFDVDVTNTGKVAGKDVVEVYFTPPYNNGGIEKASVNLVQFEKTQILDPGATETVSFSIPKEDMASYDSGIKIKEGGYILEAGEYEISVRANSHKVIDSKKFTEKKDIEYTGDNKRSSDLVTATNQFQEYSEGTFTKLSRKDGFANYEEATAAPSKDAYKMSKEIRAEVEPITAGTYDPTTLDNADDQAPTLGADNGKTLFEMVGKEYDDPDWDPLLDQLSFEDMALMINLGGWQTAAVPSVGKVATADCDGPAGLNNFITGAYGTSYPGEIVMAQTWNKALLEEIGKSMSKEYVEASNFGWYGPAMNTHRNAFAGRNFEYYSEDGVLAGYCAAAEINGAKDSLVYPYIKHFALNDQETNRCAFLMTFADEQAIREIYLKPFEMAVKAYEGKALAVMSSFNFIGTRPSTANGNLLNNVLRDEWGFVGMVETDYDGSYGFMYSDHGVRNGNDLMLGFASAPTNQFTDQNATALNAMRTACKNIMYTVVNSGYYTGVESDPAKAPDKMVTTFRNVDLGIGAILILLEALLIRSFLKRRKQQA